MSTSISLEKNSNGAARNSEQKRDSIAFIALGLVLILLSIAMDPEKPHTVWKTLLEFISHIGIGLLLLGILTILLDFSHWTHYFEKRLSNIVTEKKYLQTLDKNSLISLQTEVLKAYFNNDDIGGSDGFLNYYQRNIQILISNPFRTNVNLHYLVDFAPGDKTKLRVIETMSWTCKSNGGRIQDSVKWMPSEYEVEKLDKFEITIQHESFKSGDNEKGEHKFTPESTDSGRLKITHENAFELSLSDCVHLQNLRVQISVNYMIPQERIIAKRMAYPTRGLNLSVQYPKDLVILAEPYCYENAMFPTNQPGNYLLVSEDWIMPNEGITMQLLKKTP